MVCDTGRHTIRSCALQSKRVTTIAGSVLGFADGPGATSLFNSPFGIAATASGDLVVSDTANHRVRRISMAADGTPASVTTLAGSGDPGVADGAATAAAFCHPTGIAVEGETVYVTDGLGHTLRIICKVDGEFIRWLTMLRHCRYTFTDTTMTDAQRLENCAYVEEFLTAMVRVILPKIMPRLRWISASSTPLYRHSTRHSKRGILPIVTPTKRLRGAGGLLHRPIA